MKDSGYARDTTGVPRETPPSQDKPRRQYTANETTAADDFAAEAPPGQENEGDRSKRFYHGHPPSKGKP